MRASGEKLQDEGDKEEEEADEMIDSAAESDDDGQVLASPNSGIFFHSGVPYTSTIGWSLT